MAWVGVNMAESGTDKRTKAPMPLFKKGAYFLSSLLAFILLTQLLDLSSSEGRAKLAPLQASAYTTIAQFAPWNVVKRYVQIVATQGDDAAEKMAEQQQRRASQFRSFACSVHFAAQADDNPCTPLERPHGIRAFYLSAHVPFIFRLATAIFDMLLHVLIDQGFIGFVVAAAQIAIGILLTSIAIHRKTINLDSFVSYIVGVPLIVLGLGIVAAIPLWLLAFVSITFFKGLPGMGLAAQGGTTGCFLTWLCRKTAEDVGHKAIMNQVKRFIGD
jgi:hypothetical protein